MKDAEELLTQWGIWSWQGTGVPRCTSPMYALMRDNVAQHSEPVANITEEEAMLVDRLVATMKRRHHLMAEVVTYYYRHQLTMQDIGKGLDISRLKVREILIAGHSYIEAGLDMREAA